MFTPPIAAGLHSSGSLKALTAALLSSSSLLIYRLYYIEDFPRCQVLYARWPGQSSARGRRMRWPPWRCSALTRRYAVPLHLSANCAPARRLCLPDIVPAEAFVRAGLSCAAWAVSLRRLAVGVCLILRLVHACCLMRAPNRTAIGMLRFYSAVGRDRR